jgi:hypothetical protein
MAYQTELEDLYYRCEFARLLRRGDAALARSPSPDERLGVLLLQSQAAFERHELDDVQRLLAAAEATASLCTADAAYARGRLLYMMERYDDAESAFVAAAGRAGSLDVRAAIGLANLHYTRGDLPRCRGIVAELDAGRLERAPQLQIAVEVLRGNVALADAAGRDEARRAFFAALGTATERGWTFWIMRSLYSLAKAYDERATLARRDAYLDALAAMLRTSECHYLAFLMHRQFDTRHAAKTVALSLDHATKRIDVDGRSVDLGNKPLVFALLDHLTRASGVLAKDELARRLWPGERYAEDVHDRRLFNLVSRARQIVERHPDQPVFIRSSRAGYRLAARQTP